LYAKAELVLDLATPITGKQAELYRFDVISMLHITLFLQLL
jgi:hypothetical protein